LGVGQAGGKSKKQKEIEEARAVQSSDQVGYPPRNRNRETTPPV
jgi:hypothetical protein